MEVVEDFQQNGLFKVWSIFKEMNLIISLDIFVDNESEIILDENNNDDSYVSEEDQNFIVRQSSKNIKLS
jgi:hypothetical protein